MPVLGEMSEESWEFMHDVIENEVVGCGDGDGITGVESEGERTVEEVGEE